MVKCLLHKDEAWVCIRSTHKKLTQWHVSVTIILYSQEDPRDLWSRDRAKVLNYRFCEKLSKAR